MSKSSSHPNEDGATIFLERTFFADFVITGVGYGSMATCYLMCMVTLFSRRRKIKTTPGPMPLALYITLLFALGTMFVATDTVTGIRMFVDNREFPGGPSAYLLAHYNIAPLIIANICYQLQSWLTDALLIYRCLIVYGHNYWAILFPCLLWLGSLSMGTTLLVQEEHPNNSLWSKTSVNFAVPFFSLSISLNIIVTILISTRLLLYRYKTRAALGDQHTHHYVSLSAVLIESAALNSFFSILYLIPYSRSLAVSNAFQGLAPEMQITATLLVVLRLASGRGWTQSTTQSLNQLSATLASRGSGVIDDRSSPSSDGKGDHLDVEEMSFRPNTTV